ncbi:hypothetical protein DL95DRAFT_351646 [Leptodontidium sp. 2 PMI_412]|nr:hypothetical protein BKA61DRAFT_730753 [Leptodontidium sp. MPI-SDFR-AT-0119]KAH9224156.1 hypothetical protein DL95DRAFT_351646 [Leptodontidium sp. 2 PMI_412]
MSPKPSPSYTADVPPASSRGLSHPKRFITTHDESGKAVFSSDLPEEIPFQQIPNDAIFSLCYATNQTPVNMSENNDVNTYSNYLEKLPGVMIPGGTVLRLVDMPPGATSPMHRTVSLDYGVVMEGSVELILDDGVSRVMERGDISVQRGTIHAWRNMSKTSWARMLYILQESKPIHLEGKQLGEDYGGLQVPKSGQ